MQSLVAKPAAMALARAEYRIARHVIDHAEHGDSLVEQSDADREIAQAADEIVGAVDRIDHPIAAQRIVAFEGDGVAGVVLLADEAIGGKAIAQAGHYESLAFPVGVGHGLG